MRAAIGENICTDDRKFGMPFERAARRGGETYSTVSKLRTMQSEPLEQSILSGTASSREHTEVCCWSIDREIGSSGHEGCEPVRDYKTIDCGNGRLEVASTSTNATRRTGSSGTSTAVLRAPTFA
jgi:hypothetical protein